MPPAHIEGMSDTKRPLRQPVGIPIGGQFATEQGCSVGLRLTATDRLRERMGQVAYELFDLDGDYTDPLGDAERERFDTALSALDPSERGLGWDRLWYLRQARAAIDEDVVSWMETSAADPIVAAIDTEDFTSRHRHYGEGLDTEALIGHLHEHYAAAQHAHYDDLQDRQQTRASQVSDAA